MKMHPVEAEVFHENRHDAKSCFSPWCERA